MMFSEPVMVYCGGHVFCRERPVLLEVREEAEWQFLCGQMNHPDLNEPFHVGGGGLIAHDPSLEDVADLLPNWEAERDSLGGAWLKNRCSANEA